MTRYQVHVAQQFEVTYEVEAENMEDAFEKVLDFGSDIECVDQWPGEIIDDISTAYITEVIYL